MIGHGWRLAGGIKLRLSSSRSRGSSALAVIAGGLGVYAVAAVGFHWFVEPTVANSQAVVTYQAPAVVQYSGSAFAPAVRSDQAASVATKSPTPGTATAAKSKDTARTQASRAAPKSAPP